MKSSSITFYWKILPLLTLLMLLGLGEASLAASAETAVISGSSVNVRSGPGTSYDNIGSLSKNTSIDILERQNGWIKISFNGAEGWVAEYLTGQRPSTAGVSADFYINGDWAAFEASPISVDGYTLVPFREIMEKLGTVVSWDSSSQTIMASKCSTNISLGIGSPSASVNGQAKNLGIAAQIVNGQTYVPLRFSVEALGGKIIWDEENQSISIYCPADPGDKLTAVSVSAADLNIRDWPSTSADIVGLAPCGSILAYLSEEDGWYQVKYRGQSGWVAGWLVVPLWNAVVPADEKELTLLPVPSDPDAFVVQMLPYAETASQGTGLPVNFLLAQWAEESGYGTSSLAQYYNNFGGIKNPETGGFKKYLTASEFAQDVIAIYTTNSKYNRLLTHAREGTSIQTLFRDLSACGYASSSSYGEKIRTQYLPAIDRALGNM